MQWPIHRNISNVTIVRAATLFQICAERCDWVLDILIDHGCIVQFDWLSSQRSASISCCVDADYLCEQARINAGIAA